MVGNMLVFSFNSSLTKIILIDKPRGISFRNTFKFNVFFCIIKNLKFKRVIKEDHAMHFRASLFVTDQ